MSRYEKRAFYRPKVFSFNMPDTIFESSPLKIVKSYLIEKQKQQTISKSSKQSPSPKPQVSFIRLFSDASRKSQSNLKLIESSSDPSIHQREPKQVIRLFKKANLKRSTSSSKNLSLISKLQRITSKSLTDLAHTRFSPPKAKNSYFKANKYCVNANEFLSTPLSNPVHLPRKSLSNFIKTSKPFPKQPSLSIRRLIKL